MPWYLSFPFVVSFVAFSAWWVVDRIQVHKELEERKRNALRLVYRYERMKGYRDWEDGAA